MTVTMTSEALGKKVGETYTGPEEAWLLSEGYASQAGYTGVGVSNTGVSSVVPSKDLTLASNREDHDDVVAANAGIDKVSKQPYDYNEGGVDTDASVVNAVEPSNGKAAGGDRVAVKGDGLVDATSVTFGGVAGTSFDVIDDNEIHVVTPAHAAGAVDVVVVDADGNGTKVGGFTYA